MDDDGTNKFNFTNDIGVDIQPSLSEDASKIAWVSNRDGDFEIYTQNLDGTGFAQLTFNSASDATPEWNHDGTKLLFVTNRDGNFEVYSMDANGANQTNLTNHPSFDAVGDWSPDGTQMVFPSDRDGDQELYIVNSDGTGPVTQITFNTSADFTPNWSNGLVTTTSKIVFVSNRAGGSNLDVYTIHPDGTNETQLTTNTANDNSSTWSPDNSQILFGSDRNGGNDFYKMNQDGTSLTQFTFDSAFKADPSWAVPPVGADADGDGFADNVDNCPSIYNELQDDEDGSGDGDVCDVCPDDPLDNCLDGDAAEIVSGAAVTLSAGSATLTVFPNSTADTTLFMEDTGNYLGDYAATNLGGPFTSAHLIGPTSTTFNPPAKLCFTFDPFGFTCSDFEIGKDANEDFFYETTMETLSCDDSSLTALEICTNITTLSNYAVFLTGDDAQCQIKNNQLLKSSDTRTFSAARSDEYIHAGATIFLFDRDEVPFNGISLLAGPGYEVFDGTCGQALANGPFIPIVTYPAPDGDVFSLCARDKSTGDFLEIRDIVFGDSAKQARTLSFNVAGTGSFCTDPPGQQKMASNSSLFQLLAQLTELLEELIASILSTR